MESLRLEWRSPSELAENPRNWRRHPDAQIEALADVIGEVGWAGACLFNERTQRLIDGHARRKVAEANGSAKVPVLVGSWSEEDERKILATFDPIGAMATTDAAALEKLLAEVNTQSEAINGMLEGLAKANPVMPEAGGGGDEFDATPEESGPTRTAGGETWIIGGKHRLYVGDCTDAGNVARLMGGERVGLCFTSPPYAQQRDYGETAKEKVKDWDALMVGAFGCLPMTDDGQILVNLGLVHRDGEWVPYWDKWIEVMRTWGWRRFGWYVWDQLAGLPGVFGGRCTPSFEFIFHFNRAATTAEKWQPTKSEGHKRHGGRMGPDGWVTDYHIDRMNTTGPVKIPDATWRVGRAPDASIEHSAKFPVGLPSYALETWPGDVYDPFLGSGTTLIAAHRLNRVCYGCEIEPRYADVILKRAEAEGLSVEKQTRHGPTDDHHR